MRSLCDKCPAACCRYIALPFDEPTDKEAFEEVRWFLMHEGVSVFVTEGHWYISMAATCKHLTEDSRCDAYESRPQICRQYDTDNCDYGGGDYGYKLFFTHPEQVAEYARKKLAPKPAVKKKRRRAGGKVCAGAGRKADTEART